MSYPNEKNLDGAHGVGPERPSLLRGVRDSLNDCHKGCSELHGVADRLVGIAPSGKGASVPTAVPNGIMGEIDQSVRDLQQRLFALFERLADL